MAGTITFHFDDGFMSHYEKAFPVFRKYGYTGCLALIADPGRGMGFARAKEMQDAGWEILCHSVYHPRMGTPLPEEDAKRELWESKRILEAAGFVIREFITPCSYLHPSMRPMAEAVYDAAFTRYTNSLTQPIEELVIERNPVNRFDLHRACLSSKTHEELCAYVDYVVAHDAWIVFYDHDIGAGTNITAEGLDRLLAYTREKGAAVRTSAQVLDGEKALTRIVSDGWDGKKCFVHARMASDGAENMLITAQKLNVEGSDCFDLLNVNISHDGGRTWTGFLPDEGFAPSYEDGIRSVCCDMTPLYHKKTGKFLVTGHIAQYRGDGIFPVDSSVRRKVTPYAVFDPEKGRFDPFRVVDMPDPEKYSDCGSGCSQCYELPDGDILVPISYSETVDGVKQNAKAAVMRCSFDGETLAVKTIGAPIAVDNEVRGIGECSVIFADGKYLLTIRGDTYGYVSESADGLNYTVPVIWRWEDGETVPTYNTQSHFLSCGGRLFLVYTRKAGNNDHVFRHRAPLFVSEVNTETLRLKRETEFIAVPQRGARLGNFGICHVNEHDAKVIVTEWMQPRGCEAYGSDNALWITDIRI